MHLWLAWSMLVVVLLVLHVADEPEREWRHIQDCVSQEVRNECN